MISENRKRAETGISRLGWRLIWAEAVFVPDRADLARLADKPETQQVHFTNNVPNRPLILMSKILLTVPSLVPNNGENQWYGEIHIYMWVFAISHHCILKRWCQWWIKILRMVIQSHFAGPPDQQPISGCLPLSPSASSCRAS